MPRNRLLLMLLAVALSGCAPAVKAQGCSQLVDALPASDWQGLQGRKIVLDAGHGGKEPGAVGPGGLKEKDVNLAVTLELAALLRQAGAEVLLTRDKDQDLSLPERVAFSNAQAPDLFLSIHHNATLEPKNQLDETQTYYKMGDDGPSYELGMAIHRHLRRNLAMPRERLAPGNYYLLRFSKAPAILGEASYITHAAVEKKLATPAAIALEAQSYFLGIRAYFQNGQPKVTRFAMQESSDPARPVIVAELDGDGSPIAPASVTMTLNGAPVPVSVDASTGLVSYQPPEPLSNARHVVSLRFRNMRGNTSAKAEALVPVDNPAARAVLLNPLGAPPPGGQMPLVARFEDANGKALADGKAVTWTTSAGQLLSAVTETRDGKSINYLDSLDPKKTPTVTVTATSDQASASLRFDALPKPALMGYVSGPYGKAVADARITAVGPDQRFTAISDALGYFWFPDVPAKLSQLHVERSGYKPLTYGLRQKAFVDLPLTPAYGGAFHDQVIVINPAGGGDERGPVSDRALEAAWLNWQVADALRDYLEGAGAKVRLTRGRDDMTSDIQRVQVANDANATLFLSIAHNAEGMDDLRTEHYPSSTKGKQISEAVREALERATGQKGLTKPYSSYVLIHPACPSVTVVPGPLGRYQEDLERAQARKTAYAIFLGLQPKPAESARLALTLRYRSGKAVPNGTVMLDAQTLGLTDAAGRWTFERLEGGEHRLIVSDGRHTRTLWVVGLRKDENREIEVILDLPEVPDNAG